MKGEDQNTSTELGLRLNISYFIVLVQFNFSGNCPAYEVGIEGESRVYIVSIFVRVFLVRLRHRWD